MDNVTLIGLIMMAVIIALTATKKVPIAVIYTLIPVFTATLVLGHSFGEVIELISGQVNSAMTSTALLLIFSITFFSILSSAGMFTRIINSILRITKGNIYLVMLVTVLVTIISDLDGSLVTTYIITIPTLLPLYDHLNLDRKYLLLITALTTAVMTNYPWDIGIATMATIAGVDAMTMSIYALPVSGVALVIVLVLIFLFGKKHVKNGGSVSVEGKTADLLSESGEPDMLRPGLFWVNFALFIGLLATLIIVRKFAWFIFMIFTFLAFLINYRKDSEYKKVFGASGKTFMNPVPIILSISVMIGILKGTGMLDGFVNVLLDVMPAGMARYTHIIFALLIVPIFRFIPYQIYQALYPFVMAIGVAAGVDPVYTMLPFTVPLIFGCCCSPMVAQTFLGTELAKVDTDDYIKWAFPICLIGNVALISISLLLGFMK